MLIDVRNIHLTKRCTYNRMTCQNTSRFLLGPIQASCPQTASPLPLLHRPSVLILSVSRTFSPVSSLCQPPLTVDIQLSLHCLQADQNCQVLFCSSSPVTFKTPQFCNCLLYHSHFLILFFNRQNRPVSKPKSFSKYPFNATCTIKTRALTVPSILARSASISVLYLLTFYNLQTSPYCIRTFVIIFRSLFLQVFSSDIELLLSRVILPSTGYWQASPSLRYMPGFPAFLSNL